MLSAYDIARGKLLKLCMSTRGALNVHRGLEPSECIIMVFISLDIYMSASQSLGPVILDTYFIICNFLTKNVNQIK